jgi:CheY-like chemotaxis protein
LAWGLSGDRMPYKLLLADDSVTIQRVIELTFADEDVTVTAVGDGQQAIDLLSTDLPDIVLADVGMPKRDGYEVAEFIKNDPTLAHIPVVLLTGAFEPVDDDRARSVRCDGVLAKPFEPQLLIGRVKELLSGVTPSPAAPPPAEQQRSDHAPPFVAGSAATAKAGAAEGALPARSLVAATGAGAPAVDEDATVRVSRPPALPEEDIRLDLDSLDIRPEPPPVADASLDDYFDRLDAAFAHLTGGQPGRDGTTAARAQAGERWAADVRVTSDWPAVHPAALRTDDRADEGVDPGRAALDVSGPGPESGASSSPSDDLEAAAQAVSVPVPDAFSALLDAEREHGADLMHRGGARSAATVMLPGAAITQAFIDDVVRLVSERLGESAIREEVARTVSATAERLIREEIERLKATLR